MSISVAYASQLTITETLTGSYVSSTDPTVTINGLDTSATYTGSTTLTVSKGTAYQVPLVSGAATIDLTSLTGLTADEIVTLSTLRTRFLKLRNLSTNANAITIAKGASNGWAGLGSSFSITLNPGDEALFRLTAGAVVDSTHKTLDVTGTGAQILELEVVGG